MSEQEANQRLIDKHQEYFNSSSNRLTRYAAVIKKSDDLQIENDYIIEIAYKYASTDYDIKSLDITNFNEISLDLNLSPELIEEWYLGNIDIVFSDEIKYQNNSSQFCKPSVKLTGGISVYDEEASMSFGTAGAFFTTTEDNNTYLLSNYHVLLHDGGEINDKIVHPSKADAYHNRTNFKVIGEVYWKQDILQTNFNTMDAAIAKIYDHIKIDIGKYSKCEGISFLGLDSPKIGQNVKKCGRTTGYSNGRIRSINATVNVSNEDNESEYYINQILTTKMTEDGDSGSILVTEDNKVIGLLFSGNKRDASFANNINTIFNKANNDHPEFKFKEFV